MTLGERRRIFTKKFAELVLWIKSQDGYDCQYEDTKRTIEQQLLYFYGLTVEETMNPTQERLNTLNVLNRIKLKLRPNWNRPTKTKRGKHLTGEAGDLSIFKLNKRTGEWEYLTDTEDYRFAGEKWKSMSEKSCNECNKEEINLVWGGDFTGFKDGNHFEIEG